MDALGSFFFIVLFLARVDQGLRGNWTAWFLAASVRFGRVPNPVSEAVQESFTLFHPIACLVLGSRAVIGDHA